MSALLSIGQEFDAYTLLQSRIDEAQAFERIFRRLMKTGQPEFAQSNKEQSKKYRQKAAELIQRRGPAQ